MTQSKEAEIKFIFNEDGDISWDCTLCPHIHVAERVELDKSVMSVLLQSWTEAMAGHPGTIDMDQSIGLDARIIVFYSDHSDKAGVKLSHFVGMLKKLPKHVSTAVINRWLV